MAITPLTFSQLQAIFATQYTNVAAVPANTNAGSTLGAIGNSAALLALNVQQEIVYVDQVARASTSTGPDLDSFYNPFNVIRIGETASSGQVTLTTPSPVLVGQVVIPVGGYLTTSSGLLFVILADTLNTTGFFSTTFNGYLISGGASSANVLVQCTTLGSAGNVQAGQINQIYNASNLPTISGIASNGVSNAVAFTNGGSAELDPQYYTRAQQTLSTGTVGTINAISAAVAAVQPGLTYSVGDGLNQFGVPTPGNVSVFVNNLGTGTVTPGSLLTTVQAALNSVRAGGITTVAFAPTLTPVLVQATLHAPVGTDSNSLIATVNAVITNYINNIGLNQLGGTTECDYFSLGSAILATANVTKIDNLLINGGTADIVAQFGYQLVAGNVTLIVVNP